MDDLSQITDEVVEHVDFIVKLGGSAITVKEVNETLKLDALCKAADILARCFAEGKRFIVSHGAGSFGHIMSKQFGVALGYSSKSSTSSKSHVKYGFSVVRQSVTKLNHKVVELLVSRGIPAVSCSPCGVWTNDACRPVGDGCEIVRRLLREGFVPVLHGDCVLDRSIGCSILSSDTILQVFCEKLIVKRAIFVMDCDGVYSAAPSVPGAELLPVLNVDQSGFISSTIEIDQPTNDVTGGLSFKLNSATDIVLKSKGRVGVFICSLDGESFLDACLHGAWRENSRGTIVLFSSFQRTEHGDE